MDLKERRWKIADWINIATNMQKWRAVVNTVTNFGIITSGELRVAGQLLASKGGLCCMELVSS